MPSAVESNSKCHILLVLVGVQNGAGTLESILAVFLASYAYTYLSGFQFFAFTHTRTHKMIFVHTKIYM